MSFQLGICILLLVSPLLIAPGICLDAFFVPKSGCVSCFGGLLFLAWVMGLWKRREAPPRLGIEWPLAAVLLTSLLSIVTTPDPFPQFLPFLAVLLHVGLLYMFADFRRRAGAGGAAAPLDWALAAGVMVSGYVLLQSYGRDLFEWQGGVSDWRGKLTGTLGGPNFVAEYIAVLLFWAVYRYFSSRGAREGFPLLALTIMLACLVVTFSMGAWLGILAAVALVAWARWIGNRERRFQKQPERSGHNLQRKCVILAGLSLFIFGFYLLDNPWNGVGRSLLREAYASNRWRTGHAARRFIWQTTALMVGDHPILGVGFGNYYRVHQVYQGLLYHQRGTPHDRPTVSNVPQVHNEYYQHLAETGVLGFGCLVWLLAAGVKAARRNWRRAPPEERGALLAVCAGLAAGGVHALTAYPLRVPPSALLLTLLAGYALAPQGDSGLRLKAPPRVPRNAVFGLTGLLGVMAIYAGTAPAVAHAFLERGRTGRDPESLSAARWAARIDPWSSEVHEWLARLYDARGMPSEVLRVSETALRYRESFEMHQLRRDSFLAMSRVSEAVDEGDRMLRLNPMYPPLALEQARLAKTAGRPVEGYLDRAEQLIAGLVREGKKREAEGFARAITALDPARGDRLRKLLAGDRMPPSPEM